MKNLCITAVLINVVVEQKGLFINAMVCHVLYHYKSTVITNSLHFVIQ